MLVISKLYIEIVFTLNSWTETITIIIYKRFDVKHLMQIKYNLPHVP